MAANQITDFLVRQTWQIAVVFGVVWVACQLLRRASAHCRYLLWMLVVAKCLTPPFVSVPIALLPSQAQEASPAGASRDTTTGPADIDAAGFRFQPLAGSDSPRGQSTPERTIATATPQAANPRFTPQMWLATTWMLCAGAILVLVAGRFWVTNRRLRRLRVPADDGNQAAVTRLARTLGIRHSPEVYMSSAAPQPFVWGLIRGDIYVPRGFANYGTSEQRHAVLMHELVHVARCDAAVNLLQLIVQALFFFHPLVWWANRRLRHEREKCCDEVVLSDRRIAPELYCHALVEMLASRSQQTSWTPALAVTGSIKHIEDRIATILAPDRKFYRRPSMIGVATIALAAACLLPTGVVLTSRTQALAAVDPPARIGGAGPEAKVEPSANSADEEKNAADATAGTWQPGQEMEFRAIDARTREPLPDVTLALQNLGPGINFQDVKLQKTDANGLSLVKFPDRPAKEVRIYPSKPGYVPLRVFWEGEPHAIMPPKITIPMERGTEFGGTIRNKAGEPIPNVTVTVHYWAQGAGKNPHIRANINSVMATSDADGRWRLDIMPADVSARDLRIYVKHGNYLSDHPQPGYLPIPVIEQPPLKDLFDQTAVMVMSDGEKIAGMVTSAQSGVPISGASVYLTDVDWLDKPRATTKNDGRFMITGISRKRNPQNSNNPLALIIQAAGHAPELIEVTETQELLKIRLKAAGSVRGKVVDEAGNPVAGATILASRWRKLPLRLETKSAPDGAFTIADVPTDNVEYTISKDGYLIAEHVEMSPSKEYSVTLKSVVRIVGSVVDAETGKPLEKFSLMQGIDFDDGRAPGWLTYEKKAMVSGSYVTDIKQENFKYRIRVEAEGYTPGESRLIKPYAPDRGEITLDFKLHKAPNLRGIVEGANGKPLTNAEVFLIRGQMNIASRKVSFISPPDGASVKSDPQGRFEFPAEVESFCLVAIHEDGLGMVSDKQFAASPKITIQAWDKQKAQLEISPRPARGQSVDFP